MNEYSVVPSIVQCQNDESRIIELMSSETILSFFYKHKVFWVGLGICRSQNTDLTHRSKGIFSFPVE